MVAAGHVAWDQSCGGGGGGSEPAGKAKLSCLVLRGRARGCCQLGPCAPELAGGCGRLGSGEPEAGWDLVGAARGGEFQVGCVLLRAEPVPVAS